MMLHILYLVAFTVLAVIAIANLIRSLIVLSRDSQRSYSPRGMSAADGSGFGASRFRSVPHPELLDDTGNIINEPLLVMRSINVEDAREQLDALFKSSPGNKETEEE
ncbi:MAG: DUF2973 domain-containing protein [Crinalium sp.]